MRLLFRGFPFSLKGTYKVVGKMRGATSCISFVDEVDNVGDSDGSEGRLLGEILTPSFGKCKKCSCLSVETAIKWNFGFLFRWVKRFFFIGVLLGNFPFLEEGGKLFLFSGGII